MSKADIADNKHKCGYNCCQAVACSFAEEMGVDEATIYKLCEGFGGGMGTAKGVCGALNGAAIVAGLVNSDGNLDSPGQTKAATTRITGKLQREFEARAGAIICRDIKTGNNGGPFTSCQDCIRIAAELVEEDLNI